MTMDYVTPPQMYKSPVFSQGIILPANARLLVVGGQNSINEKGEVLYKGDVVRQTAQALANMRKVLAAAGTSMENLVKTTIIMQQDIDLRAAFGEWLKVWGNRPNPPTVTALRVTGLANPDFLIEIEALAIVP